MRSRTSGRPRGPQRWRSHRGTGGPRRGQETGSGGASSWTSAREGPPLSGSSPLRRSSLAGGSARSSNQIMCAPGTALIGIRHRVPRRCRCGPCGGAYQMTRFDSSGDRTVPDGRRRPSAFGNRGASPSRRRPCRGEAAGSHPAARDRSGASAHASRRSSGEAPVLGSTPPRVRRGESHRAEAQRRTHGPWGLVMGGRPGSCGAAPGIPRRAPGSSARAASIPVGAGGSACQVSGGTGVTRRPRRRRDTLFARQRAP